MKRRTERTRLAIVNAYKRGEPTQQILVRFSLSRPTLYIYLRKYGVPLRGQKRRINLRDAKRRRKKGESLQSIADDYGVSRQAAAQLLRYHT